MNTYLLFKSLHLISVISWMAGLLYLPRIFVYHAQNNSEKIISEVFKVMDVVKKIGVEIFNIGQYLQPTKNHLEVDRYVRPEIFKLYKDYGLKIGFKVVESGPLVRSSYHAGQQAREYSKV